MESSTTECFIYQLRVGCETRYDRYHAQVWPEVVADLRSKGVTDYTIFRRDQLVISVLTRLVEVPPVAVSTAIAAKVEEWHALMAPLFEATTDDKDDLLYADPIFNIRDYPSAARA